MEVTVLQRGLRVPSYCEHQEGRITASCSVCAQGSATEDQSS